MKIKEFKHIIKDKEGNLEFYADKIHSDFKIWDCYTDEEEPNKLVLLLDGTGYDRGIYIEEVIKYIEKNHSDNDDVICDCNEFVEIKSISDIDGQVLILL